MRTPCADCQIYGCPDDGPDFDRVRRHCDCHGRVQARYRRTEGGDRFSHNTVAVLEAFATSVVALHRILESATDLHDDDVPYWGDRAYEWARGAVRCARLLTVKEEYR